MNILARPDPRPRPRLRAALRWGLAITYVAFGIVHLRSAPGFLSIMPSWVPYSMEVVLFTGVCEILGGVGLLIPRLRWISGVMLALYAICVYPANLHHAFGQADVGGLPSSWWYHGPRLAFQPVFVWWALFAGGVIDWPFRRKPA
ncbi:DoxX family protein [Phenylobacterium sp.]|uniref:DoxX family protein n=1 Tax=Phenylobacterium sp. TaxID=1871053 RepID=UPI00286DCBF3|nr:DoxX family protein [Phenylobacterium sp.]